MTFSNEPVPAEQLPALADEAFVPVDPRYLRVSLAGVLAAAALIAFGTGSAAAQVDHATIPFAVGGVLLTVVGLGGLLRVLEVNRLGYQIREHDMSLRSGAIIHRVESLPFSRVQHANIDQGPLERAFGLATLEISSAGPNITIPGLTEGTAARIKLLVTERARVEGITDEAPDSLCPGAAQR